MRRLAHPNVVALREVGGWVGLGEVWRGGGVCGGEVEG